MGARVNSALASQAEIHEIRGSRWSPLTPFQSGRPLGIAGGEQRTAGSSAAARWGAKTGPRSEKLNIPSEFVRCKPLNRKARRQKNRFAAWNLPPRAKKLGFDRSVRQEAAGWLSPAVCIAADRRLSVGVRTPPAASFGRSSALIAWSALADRTLRARRRP